ncbi:hypothetical protein [Streptomyces sp. AM 2-1-1]|uniref:hypothetical protein n=1 Tax=Streptomyces sp. AM 2-1-1 TaxID=3028709 RepID=UPI0023B907A6|nr:hypothetical protein [Streptomyces sp. AM 2-1-1]WEH43983.1 hypothetical protein PZB77_30950 [Streptomyces sp. AM 2-1-1]
MTTTFTLTVPAPGLTGSCPDCDGSFETCTCTGTAQLLSFLAPRAGIDDIRREDDQSGHDGSGYERDETDTGFHQLVRQLVDDGDTRARSAGRRARRTLAAMAPGYERQPVLRLTRFLPMRGAEDSCPVCGRWSCKGSDCPPNSGVALSPVTAGATGGR